MLTALCFALLVGLLALLEIFRRVAALERSLTRAERVRISRQFRLVQLFRRGWDGMRRGE